MESFNNGAGKVVVEAMVAAVKENVTYLSEIDGAIGDGDHGINMNKGFSLCAEAMAGKELSYTDALLVLGKTLLMDIGGSMGPLYGGFFKAMAKTGAGAASIDSKMFLAMLDAGVASVQNIGGAQVGDKTLLDSLVPARDRFQGMASAGAGFGAALDGMVEAAEAGMLSTKDMVAKVGRAARLGERSRGVQDAGATSCFILLRAMGNSIKNLLG